MRLLPCGERAILAELPDRAARRGLAAAVAADPPSGLVDCVPAATTVLLTFATARDAAAAPAHLAALGPGPADAADGGEPLVLPVRYDGPDLADVAAILGIGPGEVVERHTGQVWTVDFTGFAPGFGYLVGEAGGLEVPRRAEPRTRVEPGSVGLAGEYSGVYPRASPGGWQLIGRCEVALFDPEREPAALLAPGVRVRFEAVG